jgi:DNA (cytosine-5)-methyltransferase 1
MDLVIACRPPTLIGEQVANAIRMGWLDDLYDSFEILDYDVSSAVIPASAVGAPHIRSRLWWIARR